MKQVLPVILALGLGFSFGSGTSALADTVNVTVPNFSFENPASAGNTDYAVYHDTPERGGHIEDWYFTVTNDSHYGTINYAADGRFTGGTDSQGVFIAPYYNYNGVTLTTGNAGNNDGTTAGATGFLTTVIPDTTYTLDVDAAIPDAVGGDVTVTLSLLDSTGATFASQTFAGSSLGTTFSNLELQYLSTGAPTDLGDGLKIALSYAQAGSSSDVVFDNVRLTESGPNIVVPEPSTWAMMILGAGGLVLLARRKLTA